MTELALVLCFRVGSRCHDRLGSCVLCRLQSRAWVTVRVHRVSELALIVPRDDVDAKKKKDELIVPGQKAETGLIRCKSSLQMRTRTRNVLQWSFKKVETDRYSDRFLLDSVLMATLVFGRLILSRKCRSISGVALMLCCSWRAKCERRQKQEIVKQVYQCVLLGI